MRSCLFLLLFPLLAVAAWAEGLPGAEVIFLGEVHDNPAHHARQAEWVSEIAPTALVFEMLTPEQAARVSPDDRSDERSLANLLGWDESGWPDFGMYYPIFAAAPQAEIYGAAIPREDARRAMEAGLHAVFGADSARFGLDRPLSAGEQAARERLQLEAHCDALPEHLLPDMVAVQRLRDAALARAALDALAQSGGPVVVITGNGHARKDWGAPRLLKRAAPSVSVHSIGQAETGAAPPEGAFDRIVWSEPAQRDDPCAVFRSQGGD